MKEAKLAVLALNDIVYLGRRYVVKVVRFWMEGIGWNFIEEEQETSFSRV